MRKLPYLALLSMLQMSCAPLAFAEDFSSMLNSSSACRNSGEPGSDSNEFYSPWVTSNRGHHRLNDFQCLVSPEELHEALKKDDIWLIDVRSQDYFQVQTIPGSLNVPGYLIKQKSQFKTGHIVLFNAGYRHAELEALCHQLEESGFHQVSVLKGGIEAWYQAGYPLTGKAVNRGEISAVDYMSTLNERAWVIIGLDASAQVLVDRAGAKAVIEYNQGMNSLISRIGQKSYPTEPGKQTSFLVVSATGEGYQEARRNLNLRGLGEIYYLSDGVAGLRRYLMTRQAQLQRIREGFKKLDSCSG